MKIRYRIPPNNPLGAAGDCRCGAHIVLETGDQPIKDQPWACSFSDGTTRWVWEVRCPNCGRVVDVNLDTRDRFAIEGKARVIDTKALPAPAETINPLQALVKRFTRRS